MIWLVTCEGLPSLFVKGVGGEKGKHAAVCAFEERMDEETAAGFVLHPTFQVRPLTLELLEEVAPDEFFLNDETSF